MTMARGRMLLPWAMSRTRKLTGLQPEVQLCGGASRTADEGRRAASSAATIR